MQNISSLNTVWMGIVFFSWERVDPCPSIRGFALQKVAVVLRRRSAVLAGICSSSIFIRGSDACPSNLFLTVSLAETCVSLSETFHAFI